MAARYEMARKGGSVPLPNFPHDDAEAVQMLLDGIALAREVPLDDVPELSVQVHADREVLERLLAFARR
jgi:hypothetical protein